MHILLYKICISLKLNSKTISNFQGSKNKLYTLNYVETLIFNNVNISCSGIDI